MTTREQHLAQAKANKAFYEELLDRPEYHDWALTVLFYAALHYVDAFLYPSDPPDHSTRNKLISRSPTLRSLYRKYRRLQDRSQDARYECYDPTREELVKARQECYDVIESAILPHVTS
ncbi:MAG: hypothetical protein FJ290_22455 [Planctomycetes bacterium]|nr:hypothetical protein [Planctomycetota bacterium]